MNKARGLFALQIAVGLLGLAASALALVAAGSAVTLRAPSAATLIEACRSFVLPDLSVASILALALGSVAFAVVARAARSAVKQARASRRYLRSLPIAKPLPDGRALVFADARPLAFCAGLLVPRVYVSSAALEVLDRRELDAVLAHEAHHARHFDPARIFVARVLSESLFFLPVLRRLGERYAALAELAADRAAVARHDGDTRALASAMLAFGEHGDASVVGIAPERVDHLMGQRIRWELPVALMAWALVAVVGLGVAALRLSAASDQAMVSLPLIAAQGCMLVMAVAPLVVGATAVLAAGRYARR